MNPKKCSHGFYLDPNGYHIYPKNTAIPINEAAKLHNKEKSTAELIEEAKKSLQKATPVTIPTPAPQTQRDKELEKTAQQYNEYFKEMQSKSKLSPSWFPKTFFDRDTKKNEEK
jgi:hypothetical protein